MSNIERNEYQKGIVNTDSDILDCDYEFAESINHGGYDSEEEFWDNL